VRGVVDFNEPPQRHNALLLVTREDGDDLTVFVKRSQSSGMLPLLSDTPRAYLSQRLILTAALVGSTLKATLIRLMALSKLVSVMVT